MKRLRYLWSLVLAMLVFLVAFALPAFAQEVEGEVAGGEAVNVAVTVTFLSIIIQYLVEWIRGRFTSLDGDVVRGIAIVLGIGSAVVFDLNSAELVGFVGLPEVLGFIATGLVIAGFSGILSAGKNALRVRDPNSTIFEEGHSHLSTPPA